MTNPSPKPDGSAARKVFDARVDALRADGVQPRDLESTQLTSPLDAVLTRIQANAAAFAEYDVTADVIAAAQSIATDFTVKVSALPTDLRTARRAPVSDAQLVTDGLDLLGRYLGYVDRKARGPAQRDAARKLGVGTRRGHAVRSLEKSYRDVLHGTQDAGLLMMLGVKSVQVQQLQAMHAKLVARLPAQKVDASTLSDEIVAIDRLQLALELFYADVDAAAEWALPADERLAVVSLLPRVETSRKSSKPTSPAAPVAAEEGAAGMEPG